jgi:Na+-driven multidrug efflux pump
LLDALGLANLTANCCGGMFIVGMNQGFGSLMGRAHGADSDRLKINYLNKGIWTMVLVFTVLMILIFNTATIFIAIG